MSNIEAITSPVSIEHGGTGATDVASARANLETRLVTFTNLAQIGITQGEETIESIIQAMPNNSMLTYSVGDGYNMAQGVYPKNASGANLYGTIRIIKVGISRTILEFYTSNAVNSFVGSYYSGASTPWLGWQYRVQSSQPITFSINSSGGLRVTY